MSYVRDYEKKGNIYLKRKCTLVFNAALLAIAKMWNQPKYRLIRIRNIDDVVCMYIFSRTSLCCKK